LQHTVGGRSRSDDHVDLQTKQFFDKIGQTLRFRLSKACLDEEVLSLDIAQVAHPLQERSVPVGACPGLSRTEIKKTDARHLPGRLRLGDERRSKGAKRQPAQERAPVHSITWSARCRTDSGMVTPSAFAVLALMIKANFVGCSMGRLLGLAPFRI